MGEVRRPVLCPGHSFWLKAEGVIAARPVGNTLELLLELSGAAKLIAVMELWRSSPTFPLQKAYLKR